MDKSYLEKLLERTKSLVFNDFDSANDIKVKTIECFNFLFPNDILTILEVRKLQFEKSEMTTGIYGIGTEKVWINGSKNKLITILESKIDVLTHKQNESIKPVKTNFNLAEYLNKHTSPLNIKIDILTNNNERNELIIEEKINEIILIKNQLSKAKTITWIKNTSLLSLILVLIGGSFLFGFYFGNNRFDSEKLNLVDTVKSQKLIIEKIKKENQKLEMKKKSN